MVDVICGNVAQQGETGFPIARTAGILAGFPFGVPGAHPQPFDREITPITLEDGTIVTKDDSSIRTVGLETMCAAGSMAMAMVIERLA